MKLIGSSAPETTTLTTSGARRWRLPGGRPLLFSRLPALRFRGGGPPRVLSDIAGDLRRPARTRRRSWRRKPDAEQRRYGFAAVCGRGDDPPHGYTAYKGAGHLRFPTKPGIDLQTRRLTPLGVCSSAPDDGTGAVTDCGIVGRRRRDQALDSSVPARQLPSPRGQAVRRTPCRRRSTTGPPPAGTDRGMGFLETDGSRSSPAGGGQRRTENCACFDAVNPIRRAIAATATFDRNTSPVPAT